MHSGFKQFVMPSEEEFSRIDEILWSPEFPAVTSLFIQNMKSSTSTSTSTSTSSLSTNFSCLDRYKQLENENDITMKLLCSYLK